MRPYAIRSTTLLLARRIVTPGDGMSGGVRRMFLSTLKSPRVRPDVMTPHTKHSIAVLPSGCGSGMRSCALSARSLSPRPFSVSTP